MLDGCISYEIDQDDLAVGLLNKVLGQFASAFTNGDNWIVLTFGRDRLGRRFQTACKFLTYGEPCYRMP